MGQKAPASRAGLSHDLNHTLAGLQNDKKTTNEATMLLKAKKRVVEMKLKQANFQPEMRPFEAEIELFWHDTALPAGLRREHSTKCKNDPAEGNSRSTAKHKNSGNEAKKLLKTKDLSFWDAQMARVLGANQSELDATGSQKPIPGP